MFIVMKKLHLSCCSRGSGGSGNEADKHPVTDGVCLSAFSVNVQSQKRVGQKEGEKPHKRRGIAW